MEEVSVKQAIAKNLAFYRKRCNMTQMELAERINYSDKSVSKWERGEGIPDIVVLTLLAEIYGVTVNDLISESEPKEPVKPQESLTFRKKILLVLLSVGLVWLVATVVFFVLKLVVPHSPHLEYSFIIALPVSAIVALVFCCLWWGWLVRCAAISLLVWTCALCFDVLLWLENTALIYMVAAVLQVLVILWFFYMEKDITERGVEYFKKTAGKIVKTEQPEKKDEQ